MKMIKKKRKPKQTKERKMQLRKIAQGIENVLNDHYEKKVKPLLK